MRALRRRKWGLAIYAAFIVLEYAAGFAVAGFGLWLICSLFSAAFRYLGVG